MKEKKCTITTIRRGNVTETVIESDSPRLKAFCEALREAKAEKQERLRKMEKCDVRIRL